nr:putative F-box/kelch-repeat protein At1g15680 isoform X1 [Ipomoea trifida]
MQTLAPIKDKLLLLCADSAHRVNSQSISETLQISPGHTRLVLKTVATSYKRLLPKGHKDSAAVADVWPSTSAFDGFLSALSPLQQPFDSKRFASAGILSSLLLTLLPASVTYATNIFNQAALFSDLHILVTSAVSLTAATNANLQTLRFEGSFADLILFSCINLNTYKVDYYVSNLLTRQWIALPPAAYEDLYVSTGFLCVTPPLDTTSHHHEFMVVRLCSGNCAYTPRSRFKAQVFSSENWQWRTLVVSSPLTLEQHIGGISLVAYRGMLHWLNGDCIVVYDPLNTPQRFSRIIHLPAQLRTFDISRFNCFGVSLGCLRVTGVLGENIVNPDPVLDVWELEDYDSGLWNLVHKVRLKSLIHNGLLGSVQSELWYLSVISFHPENGDLIYLRLNSEVVLVNMKNRIIERFYPMDDMAEFGWADAFHLVDQWWPTTLSLQGH